MYIYIIVFTSIPFIILTKDFAISEKKIILYPEMSNSFHSSPLSFENKAKF